MKSNNLHNITPFLFLFFSFNKRKLGPLCLNSAKVKYIARFTFKSRKKFYECRKVNFLSFGSKFKLNLNPIF